MADKLPEHTGEHQHESEVNDSIQKHQETSGEDAAANAVDIKTLTNIYYDCLERIFDFLDLQSLLNVAGTCKRLRIAAAVKFGDDFGEKTVVIACSGGNRVLNDDIDQDFIYVRSLKFGFPLLRCFGAKISKLHIISLNDHLDAYINQYCADTLTSMTYQKRSQFSAQAFQKPFKRVEYIALSRCDLQEQLPSFVDWFPNMQRLSIDSSSVVTAATSVNFSNLTVLIVLIVRPSLSDLALENFKNLLQSNQQLQHIILVGPVDLKFSTGLDMINGNRSIMSLTITVQCITSKKVTMVDLNRFATEHPSVKVLFFNDYQFAADDVINFIQKLNTLKNFRFLVNGRSECDRLVSQLDKEWQHEINATDDGDFVIKLKRE